MDGLRIAGRTASEGCTSKVSVSEPHATIPQSANHRAADRSGPAPRCASSFVTSGQWERYPVQTSATSARWSSTLLLLAIAFSSSADTASPRPRQSTPPVTWNVEEHAERPDGRNGGRVSGGWAKIPQMRARRAAEPVVILADRHVREGVDMRAGMGGR
jgi:hypothetical protein